MGLTRGMETAVVQVRALEEETVTETAAISRATPASPPAKETQRTRAAAEMILSRFQQRRRLAATMGPTRCMETTVAQARALAAGTDLATAVISRAMPL